MSRIEQLTRLVERIEAVLAVTATMCLCGFAVNFAIVWLSRGTFLHWHALVHMSLLMGTLGLFYGRFLVRAWTVAVGGVLPYGPAVARTAPPPNSWCGPPLASWWLAHFAFGLASAHGFARIHARGGAAEQIVLALFVIGFTAASNLLLAMALYQLSGRINIVSALWRNRVFLDAAIVAAVLASP